MGPLSATKLVLLQNVLHRSMRLIMKRPLLLLLVSHLFMPSYCYATLVTLHEPHTYREASTDPLWQIAIKEELDALSKNHTWDLMTLPPRKFVVGCKWIYKIKIALMGPLSATKLVLLQNVLHRSMRLIMKRPLLLLLVSHLFMPSYCYTTLVTLHEPHTYHEASTNPLWQIAMKKELDKNNT